MQLEKSTIILLFVNTLTIQLSIHRIGYLGAFYNGLCHIYVLYNTGAGRKIKPSKKVVYLRKFGEEGFS